MNIKDIFLLRNDELIPTVTGRITKIHPAKAPTANQVAKGIEPMDFEIEDEGGQSIRCQILRKSMHFGPENRGKIITMSCTDVEGKGPMGLSLNIWKRDNGETKYTIVVSQHAIFKMKTETQASSEAPAQQQPAKRQMPEAHSDGVELRTKLYLDTFEEVLRQATERFAGTPLEKEIKFENVQSLATTIWLSFKGEYGKYLPPSFSFKSKGEVAADIPQQKPAQQAKQAPQTPPNPGKVISAIIADSMAGTLLEKIDRARNALTNLGVTWEKLYDHLAEVLRQSYSEADINRAHDYLRTCARSGQPKLTDEMFYESIFTDFATLKSEIESKPPFDDEKPIQETQTEDDDIPL